MRQVDGYLAFSIGILRGPGVGVLGEDSAHAKLSCHTERDGADDGARTEICELVAVVSHALLRAVVAVDKGRVGDPGIRRLVFEFLAVWVACLDPMLYFFVHCLLNNGLHFGELRSDATDILHGVRLAKLMGAFCWCRSTCRQLRAVVIVL